MKIILVTVLRVAALVMAVFALIAAVPDSQDLFSVRVLVWLSASLVAFFGERVIEKL